jgi:hypothetical protein
MQVKTLVLVNVKYVTYNTNNTKQSYNGRPADSIHMNVTMDPLHQEKKVDPLSYKIELLAKSHARSVQNLHVCGRF